jgi:hypothetical protein
MASQLYAYALTTALNLSATCFLIVVVSLATIYMFKLDRINDALRHPMLQHAPFKRLPRSLQAGILLDYFLRLAFPRAQRSVFGQANQALAHVDPAKVPIDVKWPIVGLWGGCWVGLVAMIALWVLLLFHG